MTAKRWSRCARSKRERASCELAPGETRSRIGNSPWSSYSWLLLDRKNRRDVVGGTDATSPRTIAVTRPASTFCQLPKLLRSALAGFRHLETLVHDIVRYPSDNAARAHPHRDRVRGRMRFGLEYVGASPPDTRAAVVAAMAGHIRGKATMVGLYKR
jgi:hypothetical protein